MTQLSLAIPTAIPPPPPFGLDTQLCDDEIDVDVDDHQGEVGGDPANDRGGHGDGGPPTTPEGCEYLGTYPSVVDYLRAMLEPEISPGCHWLLDLVWWEEVLARWESDGSRLYCEGGHVFRLIPTCEA